MRWFSRLLGRRRPVVQGPPFGHVHPDQPDMCPRCLGTIPYGEGGSDTPLCDPCWAKATPFWRGYWSGRVRGWSPEPDGEAYMNGFDKGRAIALAHQVR